MATYRNDPRWLDAKFAGTCAKCGQPFGRGARIFYYPNGRRAFYDECAHNAAADFEAARADEER